jgi:hypothetical protein
MATGDSKGQRIVSTRWLKIWNFLLRWTDPRMLEGPDNIPPLTESPPSYRRLFPFEYSSADRDDQRRIVMQNDRTLSILWLLASMGALTSMKSKCNEAWGTEERSTATAVARALAGITTAEAWDSVRPGLDKDARAIVSQSGLEWVAEDSSIEYFVDKQNGEIRTRDVFTLKPLAPLDAENVHIDETKANGETRSQKLTWWFRCSSCERESMPSSVANVRRWAQAAGQLEGAVCPRCDIAMSAVFT